MTYGPYVTPFLLSAFFAQGARLSDRLLGLLHQDTGNLRSWVLPHLYLGDDW